LIFTDNKMFVPSPSLSERRRAKHRLSGHGHPTQKDVTPQIVADESDPGMRNGHEPRCLTEENPPACRKRRAGMAHHCSNEGLARRRRQTIVIIKKENKLASRFDETAVPGSAPLPVS
jgi:hypothetical protein